MTTRPIRIQILHVPDCPLVDRLRHTVTTVLTELSLTVPIEHLSGPYPSPTLLINDIDVATGRAAEQGLSCRLVLPTIDQIRQALLTAAAR